MGAGVLPFAIHKGHIYFLFSREYINANVDPGLWSDFGGKEEKNETVKETAIRECYEESNGFMGSKHNIKRLINNSLTDISIDYYKTYLVNIDYDKDLPDKFRKDFLNTKKNKPEIIYKNGLYEKDMVKWMQYKDLSKNMHIFRPWYKNVIRFILHKM